MEGFQCNGAQLVTRKHRDLDDQLILDGRQKAFFGVKDLRLLTVRDIGGLQPANAQYTTSIDVNRVCDPGHVNMATGNFAVGDIHPHTKQIQFCMYVCFRFDP